MSLMGPFHWIGWCQTCYAIYAIFSFPFGLNSKTPYTYTYPAGLIGVLTQTSLHIHPSYHALEKYAEINYLHGH